MITGVTIGGYDCYADLNMVLASREIGLPEAQVYTVEVPGRNGDLDLTDALFDGSRYGNRTIALKFVTTTDLTGDEWPEFLSDVAEAMHGQKLQIVFDEDPEYYYLGRCAINSFTTDCYKHEVEVDCDCRPYKYKLSKTTVEVESPATVTLSNEQMPAIPTVTTDAEVTIATGSSSLALSAGTYILTDFELSAGETQWTLTGEADVTITYQEGRL